MDLGFIHGLWSLLILVIFIAIVAFVWRRDRRNYYDQASRIPFSQDDDKQERRNRTDEMSDDDNV